MKWVAAVKRFVDKRVVVKRFVVKQSVVKRLVLDETVLLRNPSVSRKDASNSRKSDFSGASNPLLTSLCWF